MYEIVRDGEFVSVKKDGKTIECLSDIYVDRIDALQLRELISLANKQLVKQKESKESK